MATLIVTPQRDSYMNGKSPNTNYDPNGDISQGIGITGASKTTLLRAIVNFDVSALPGGAQILGASMSRYLRTVNASRPFGVWIARCSRPATWTESGVTWNKYDGSNVWTSAGGDMDLTTPAQVAYVEQNAIGTFVVTGLGGFVRDALDYRSGIVSLIFRNVDEAPLDSQTVVWYGRNEMAESHRWKLVIDYNTAGDPGRGGGRGARTVARGVAPAGGVAARRPAPPVGPSEGGLR